MIATEKHNLEQVEYSGKLVVSWDHLDRDSKKLASMVRESGCKIDSILGVARGGLPTATILSHQLDVEMSTIHMASYRGSDGKKQADSVRYSPIATIDGLGKNVLVVDDLTESGKTMIKLEELLKCKYGVENVYTAVLFQKGDDYTPDFFVNRVAKTTWIELPFERSN
jgi:hypoxanthine phosphoribosyltransferase